MTDIVERHGSVYFLDDLDDCPEPWRSELEHRYDEIERLRRVNDLLRAETSNPRYWEARYRDEAAEVERLREELDTWQSVFPDIAPEHVQPDRSLLEKEIAGLRAALRSVIEAWDNEYDGEMAVDRAIGEARGLLPQTGDEG